MPFQDFFITHQNRLWWLVIHYFGLRFISYPFPKHVHPSPFVRFRAASASRVCLSLLHYIQHYRFSLHIKGPRIFSVRLPLNQAGREAPLQSDAAFRWVAVDAPDAHRLSTLRCLTPPECVSKLLSRPINRSTASAKKFSSTNSSSSPPPVDSPAPSHHST